ncbi:MAG: transcriptional regulator [Phycisphaerales bacterium]|nr:MAG: transcriptional regulator [Phycisphaerales bacterium]
MTQNEVATRLRTTADTVRNWEKNHSSPAIRYMPKIIEFLGYIPFEMQLENLGQKIRSYRQLLGLRQKDLARQLGVDRGTIGYLEKGKHKPGKRLERELAAFLSPATCAAFGASDVPREP